jgi:Ino eighty subunit 1
MADPEGARSPGSTIDAASDTEDNHDAAPSSPARGGSFASKHRHLVDNDSMQHSSPMKRDNWDDWTQDDSTLDPTPVSTSKKKGPGKGRPKGSVNNTINPASSFTGHKIPHLKKEDGEPLWRKDIQYEFLKAIFEDDQKVFTNSYEPETLGKQTFAEVYIDAMARSSKTSKILRDKLLSEHEPAKNMAMVCLLVNLGRMNTTLNCEWLCRFNLFKAYANKWFAQSFLRCAHSSEHITQFHHCKPAKIQTPINSSKTHRV